MARFLFIVVNDINATGVRTLSSLLKAEGHEAAISELCYVHHGKELVSADAKGGVKIWDLAAGSLIIREAGSIVSGLDGSEDYLGTGHVLCGTPKIYAGLARLCAHEIKAILHASV